MGSRYIKSLVLPREDAALAASHGGRCPRHPPQASNKEAPVCNGSSLGREPRHDRFPRPLGLCSGDGERSIHRRSVPAPASPASPAVVVFILNSSNSPPSTLLSPAGPLAQGLAHDRPSRGPLQLHYRTPVSKHHPPPPRSRPTGHSTTSTSLLGSQAHRSPSAIGRAQGQTPCSSSVRPGRHVAPPSCPRPRPRRLRRPRSSAAIPPPPARTRFALRRRIFPTGLEALRPSSPPRPSHIIPPSRDLAPMTAGLLPTRLRSTA